MVFVEADSVYWNLCCRFEIETRSFGNTTGMGCVLMFSPADIFIASKLKKNKSSMRIAGL
jgi:hypothetical protein